MISVVAPNLNEQAHLPMFLRSLERQTFKDFEVIVVDGESTDGSKEVLSREVITGKLNLKVLTDHTRNLGYIRNVGARHARGDILFNCNTDNYLEPSLLDSINHFYLEHPRTISLSGRVFPLGTSIVEHLAYQAFDFLRFIFTCAPMPVKKYRPSGSFTSVRRDAFWGVGGFPEVPCNEDGLFGQKLDGYARRNHKSVVFNLKMYVGHHVKKFRQMGNLQAILFYFYTLGNLFPMLQPLLKPVERRADLTFQGKPCRTLGVKDLLRGWWEWL